MGALFSFSLYSGIILALLYLCYKWVLAGENQHWFNRIALWLIYTAALTALPAVALFSGMLSDNAVAIDRPMAIPELEIDDTPVTFEMTELPDIRQPFYLTAILGIYLAGMVIVMIHTLWIGIRLYRVIRQGEKREIEGYTLVLISDTSIAPFSWCRYVVMSRSDWEESGQMILTHELQHLRLCHWIDLLLAQAVGILQWYNPAAWLMREELKSVHEYQADYAVIDAGVNARDYQMLLIKKAVGARFPSLANSLNHSKLKKRITMMYNQNSSASRRLRGLALVPALAAAIAVTDVEAVASVIADVSSAEMAVPSGDGAVRTAPAPSDIPIVPDLAGNESLSGQSSETVAAYPEPSGRKVSENAGISQNESRPVPQETDAVVSDEPQKPQTVSADNLPDNALFVGVEQKPEFPGGDAALMKYLSDNIRYPKNAHDNKIEGRVVISFVIQKDGTIGETKILRSVDPELDAEALRVVRSLPAFTPGKMNGKAVAVWYSLPIAFKLKGMDTGKEDDGLSSRAAAMLVNGRPVIIVDGEKVNVDVYVDGKHFEGSLDEIDPSTIQEMKVEKGDGYKKDAVYITLKK